MPAVSKKQQRFMALCRNRPEKANKECPPKSVAEDFSRLDRRKARMSKMNRETKRTGLHGKKPRG